MARDEVVVGEVLVDVETIVELVGRGLQRLVLEARLCLAMLSCPRARIMWLSVRAETGLAPNEQTRMASEERTKRLTSLAIAMVESSYVRRFVKWAKEQRLDKERKRVGRNEC